jgi:hypothetical protein
MPKVAIRPLAELFRASVLKMLKDEGRLDDTLIKKILTWRHNSGFFTYDAIAVSYKQQTAQFSFGEQYMLLRALLLSKPKPCLDNRQFPAKFYSFSLRFNAMLIFSKTG